MTTHSTPPILFTALEAFQVEGTQNFETRLVQKSLQDLPFSGDSDPGLTVRVHYSALNYKDALSAAGNRGVTRQYPHTPGIDAAGTVTHSDDPRFAVGDAVIVTSYDLGMNTPGGFAEYIRVPADWAVPLPEGMGQRPDQGPVVVTGASGGVGSLAVLLLADLGYTVWAVSGKPDYHDTLLSLGAARCLSREEVDDSSEKPLLRPRWSGAIDTVGGNTLATLIKACDKEGAIAVCGLVRSPLLETTVYPWILNGIHLLGVDSATYPAALRQARWQALALRTSVLQSRLHPLIHDLALSEVPAVLSDMLAGNSRGRYRVQLIS